MNSGDAKEKNKAFVPVDTAGHKFYRASGRNRG